MGEEKIKNQLKQLNGLYIPGNSKTLVAHGDFPFTKAVQKILRWAQAYNDKDDQTFPIMGVGYGMLSLIKSQMYDDKQLPSVTPRLHQQLNLAHEPEHTYIFDEYNEQKLENILDKITLYSDLTLGMTMNDFILREKTLGQLFVPVASFDDPQLQSANDEVVAVVEGVIYPWFGIAYRVDKIQFAFDDDSERYLDQSRETILHAQKIANLFVDEARLNSNQYGYISFETADINKIRDNDAHLIEVPIVKEHGEDLDDLMLSEVYYF